MERKQTDSRNQQSSNHNSNCSNSSSINCGSKSRGDYQGLPRSSTPPFRRPNPDSLFQNTLSELNKRWIKRNESEQNSSNSITIGGDGANSERNRMPNVEIQENLTIEGCDDVSKCAMTIRGCDNLQTLLAAEDGGLRETIVTRVAADLPILMLHKIGFQFAKALFTACDEQQMSRVLQSVMIGNESAFVFICTKSYGRESAKELIHNLKIEAQVLIVTNVLEAHICNFTNHNHCQNVLQFFIDTCNYDLARKRLFKAMADNCISIGTNGIGCKFLQQCINPMFIKDDLISHLLNKIAVNSLVLAKDKCGNYLVQHVVDANIEDVTKCIVGVLMEGLCELAKCKSGSNVVQMCMKKCEQREFVKIVDELKYSSQLLSIAQHPFGNYVLRCALEQLLTKGCVEHYRKLVKVITNVHGSDLQDDLYGKKVIKKIYQLNCKFLIHKKVNRSNSIL